MFLADLSCIWMISNKALIHYDTTAGCYLEALLKFGCVQKLDRVQGHSDSTARQCQQGLNLKVARRDPIWALRTPAGRTASPSLVQGCFLRGFSRRIGFLFRPPSRSLARSLPPSLPPSPSPSLPLSLAGSLARSLPPLPPSLPPSLPP